MENKINDTKRLALTVPQDEKKDERGGTEGPKPRLGCNNTQVDRLTAAHSGSLPQEMHFSWQFQLKFTF